MSLQRRTAGHLLDRFQSLRVFLLSLFNLSEAAAPDVDLHLHLLPHRHTAQEEQWLAEKQSFTLKVSDGVFIWRTNSS